MKIGAHISASSSRENRSLVRGFINRQNPTGATTGYLIQVPWDVCDCVGRVFDAPLSIGPFIGPKKGASTHRLRPLAS